MTSPSWRTPLVRQSSLLVDWRADDASLRCRTGQLAAFARASTGDAVTLVGTVTMPSGMPRWEMLDTAGAGVDELGLRVDRASGPRAVEAVSIPVLFGLPNDLTVYVRHAPTWYATAGGVGTAHRYLFTLGGSVPQLYCYRSSSSGVYLAGIDTSGTDRTETVAAPVTRVQEVCVQFAALLTGGTVRVDAGAGFGSTSAAASAIAALGSAVVHLGCFSSTGTEADSGLLSFKVASGLYTLAEMRTKV